MGAEDFHGGEADGVHTDHDAGALMVQDVIVALEHLVEVAGDVGGVHDALAGAVGVAVDDVHDGGEALVEGAVRAVGLEFVVLDEVDASFDERADLCGGGLGRHAYGGLDDGADDGAAVDSGELAGSGYSELGALIFGEEDGGQGDVEEFEAGELLEFGEIARDGGEQVGQGGAEVFDGPGEGDFGGAADAVPGLWCAAAGERRCGGVVEFGDFFYAGCVAFTEFVGLAGDADEGAGRLLSGHGGGGGVEREGGFNPVAGLYAVSHFSEGNVRGKGQARLK